MPRNEKPTKEERELLTVDQRSFEVVGRIVRGMAARDKRQARRAARVELPPPGPSEADWGEREIL